MAGNNLTRNNPESISVAWLSAKLIPEAICQNYVLYMLFGSGLRDSINIFRLAQTYDVLYTERNRHGSSWNAYEIALVNQLLCNILEAYEAILHFTFNVLYRISTTSFRSRMKRGTKDALGISKLENCAQLEKNLRIEKEDS